MVTFGHAADRLEQGALDLFCQMAEVHLGASGERMFFHSVTFGGGYLDFAGDGTDLSLDDVDSGLLKELERYGFLASEQKPTSTAYRVTGDGLAFYKWYREQQGAAVAQVEDVVRQLLDGPAFAAAHPGSAHHLNEALALLWQDRTDEQVVSEIGDHLRKALMDVVTDVVGDDGGKAEMPIPRLKEWVAARPELQERERVVLDALVELADKVLRLDHRANHVRDEADKGVPPPSRAELRRAAFLTATVCYEIAQLT